MSCLFNVFNTPELTTHFFFLKHFLTNCSLVTPVWSIGHHWFRQLPIPCLTPSHYLYQCWLSVNWTLRNKRQRNFLIRIQKLACIRKCWLQNGGHFVQALMWSSKVLYCLMYLNITCWAPIHYLEIGWILVNWTHGNKLWWMWIRIWGHSFSLTLKFTGIHSHKQFIFLFEKLISCHSFIILISQHTRRICTSCQELFSDVITTKPFFLKLLMIYKNKTS